MIRTLVGLNIWKRFPITISGEALLKEFMSSIPGSFDRETTNETI